MVDFKSTPLFGGAITVDLPVKFADVSAIREVPDHQEVYLDTDGYTNVIVEILERVTSSDAPTDEDALKYHYHDIVSTESDEVKFWNGGVAVLSKLPNIPAYTLFATQHVDRSAPGRQSKEDFTATLLILVRLEKQETDLLIAVNVPHLPGEYDKDSIDLPKQRFGKLIEEGLLVRTRVLGTFEVKDWNLFGGGN